MRDIAHVGKDMLCMCKALSSLLETSKPLNVVPINKKIFRVGAIKRWADSNMGQQWKVQITLLVVKFC